MIKSLNYLNNVLARIEANKANANEAIMLNQNGTIAEGTGDNVFIVKNGKLVTPPTTAGALEGVTRNTIMKLAEEEKIDVSEREITAHELYNADEAFLTGTAAEVAPLVAVDGKKIGGGTCGSVTARLIDKFKAIRKTGTPVYPR